MAYTESVTTFSGCRQQDTQCS